MLPSPQDEPCHALGCRVRTRAHNAVRQRIALTHVLRQLMLPLASVPEIVLQTRHLRLQSGNLRVLVLDALGVALLASLELRNESLGLALLRGSSLALLATRRLLLLQLLF